MGFAKRFLVIALLFPTTLAHPLVAISAAETILVDVEKGIVDGINLLAGIEAIRPLVGEGNVSTEEWPVDGGPITVYVLKIKGHQIYAHYNESWVDVTIKDPVFRTREGLKAGSKVKEFNKAYQNKPRITEVLGETISYILEPNRTIVGIQLDVSKIPLDQLLSMKEDDPALGEIAVRELGLRYIVH